jgi:hypothetical protein
MSRVNKLIGDCFIVVIINISHMDAMIVLILRHSYSCYTSVIHGVKFSYNSSIVRDDPGNIMEEYSVLYFICIILFNNSYGHLYSMLLVVFEITLVSHTYILNIIVIMILSATRG